MSTNGDFISTIAMIKEGATTLVSLDIPDSGLAAMEQVDDLLEVIDMLQLAAEQRIRKVDVSGEAKAAGYSSTASWLRRGGRMNKYAAGALRRNGKQFSRLPDTVNALRSGEISHGMASAIATAVSVLPDDEDIATTERTLLDLARSEEATVEKVAVVGRHLRHVLDPDGSLKDEEKAHRNRYLSVHLDENGGIAGTFYLPPEHAARLQALLDKYAGPRTAGDTRLQSQRNADALIQLLSENVDAELLVLVNGETLNGSNTPGRLMATGHPIPAAHVQRLANTSKLYRMVVSAKGKPLDLGSGVRLVPGWMRRAILAQYDSCAYDDCTISAKHCQMDHAYDWSIHHRTKLDEIVPACAHHNRDRATHPNKYTLTRREDGRRHFTSTTTAYQRAA